MPKPWELTDDELAEGAAVGDGPTPADDDFSDDHADLPIVQGNDPWGDEPDESLSGSVAEEPTAAMPVGRAAEPKPATKAASIPAPRAEPKKWEDHSSAFDDDDEPDSWDAVVPAPEVDDVGYRFAPVARAAEGGAVFVSPPTPAAPQEESVDDEEDDSLTVTLRRTKPEDRPAPPRARQYRTRPESRRSQEAPARRDKLSTNAGPPKLMDRVRSAFGGGEDKTVSERAVKRAAISPLNVVTIAGKGGVGKTTLTMLLGMAFASVRGDRVLTVDASPCGGNLSSRGPREGRGTVVSLLDQLDYVSSYANVREHTSQGPTGLEVLGADRVKIERRIDGQDYRRLVDEFRRHYTLILSDTPGSIMELDPDMVPVILDEADVLVLAVEGVDGMDLAVRAINFLKAMMRETDDQHIEKLLSDMVVVVNSRVSKSSVDVSKVVKHFEENVSSQVVTVPFDPVMEGGVEIDFDRISGKTHKAVMKLAAAVTSTDGFTGR